ncbi:MAG: hypothetical protein ACJAWV_000001 [Flammeovirgaceae bacterium]|jgi:hypothetical protein
MKDWKKVFSSSNHFQASLVQQVLENNELQAILLNKKDSAYGVFGEVEIYVSKKNVMQALKIINDEIDFR